MRVLIPGVALLLAGCSGFGPMRMRPGSNVVLPERVSVKDALLKEAACAALRHDSTSAARGKVLPTACLKIGPVTPAAPPR